MDVVGRRCRRSVVVVVSRRRSVSTAKEAASFVVGCWGGAVDLCEERLQLLTPTHGLKGQTGQAASRQVEQQQWLDAGEGFVGIDVHSDRSNGVRAGA